MSYLAILVCFSFTTPCWSSHSQLHGDNDVIETPAFLDGDVIIGGLFDIFYTKQRVHCDVDLVNVYSVMEMEAVKWSLKRLNDIDFIPGVSLGLLAYPTCGVPAISTLQASKFLQQLRENKASNKTKKPPFIKAVMGPTFSSESANVSRMLSSVPDDYKLLQMSFSSTAAFLTNVSNKYTNFFRTIPSDEIQIETIVQLLIRLEWTYIGLFHSGDSYGIDATLGLRKALAKKRICVAAVYQCNNVHSRSKNHYHEILHNITSLNLKGIVLIGDAEMALSFIESVGDGPFFQYPIPSIIFSESIGMQPQNFKIPNSGKFYPATKGAFVLSPPHKEVSEFSDYWRSLFINESKYEEERGTNPWLKTMFDEFQKSFVAEDFVRRYPSSNFIPYAIMATYSIAKVIKNVHSQICSGKRGLCTDMEENRGADYIEMARKTVVDFEKDFGPKAKFINLTEQISFSVGGDVNFSKSDILYEAYNIQSSNKDGDFKPVRIASLKKIETPVEDRKTEFSFFKNKVKFYSRNGTVTGTIKSVCEPNTTCSMCLPNQEIETFLYIPGDLIVVVTFPIHDRGIQPLHCGSLRRSIGLDVALGAEFVINKLNKDMEIFPNKKIGLLFLDTCDDPLLTSNSILDLHLHSKLEKLEIPGISDKILGYAGGFSSTPTLQVAEITTELKFAQVSCCATSDLLSDRLNYPYFLGLATPLNHTTRVMLQIVRALGSNNIQVLYTDGKYGESAVKLILNLAPKFNICVSQTLRIYEQDSKSIDSIISNLRRYPAVRYVLAYISSPLMPRVAEVINDNMRDRLEFRFIGENGFNHREYMLKYPKLRGSLIVAEQQIPQSDEYKTFLRNRDPSQDMPESLVYFMQENLNCYYDFSFRKQFPQKCHHGLLHKFPEHLDPWTPYLIKSTTALVKGAYSAIQSMCKEGTICAEYREHPERVIEFVRNVTLDIDGDDREDQLFDNNGNGVLGLNIYSIKDDFEEVGKWRHDRPDIIFQPDRMKIYPYESICEDFTNSVLKSVIKEEGTDNMTLIKTILLSVSAGIIVLLVLLLICICRRQSFHTSSESSVATSKSDYNSIDDFSISNMKRISSEASWKLSDALRMESPCGTPKSARSMENIGHHRNEKLPSSNKSSPLIPQFRNFPGMSHQMTSQRKMLHHGLRSEPVLHVSSPSTSRRLNSETLPTILKSRTGSVDIPKSRRQHSEPTLLSSNFNKLLYQDKRRKESLQDNGYISPIAGPDEELPLDQFHEAVQLTDQTDKHSVVFVVGNPKKHIQVYSC
ncbi:uncharacterized protein LOC125647262 [Ostrea edulis]|uniref:uncharacterized protein LOC125647262 n=1 Tax=Ostrea edulis TaxID=37623 RepID=UPI0024AFBB7E|nr:uncharacterized protein LOC125647262 [Ostrea edulis]